MPLGALTYVHILKLREFFVGYRTNLLYSVVLCSEKVLNEAAVRDSPQRREIPVIQRTVYSRSLHYQALQALY